ncbi:uncharacterized protein LOC121339422 [Onychostruthus taczanowskii]|uniref:uncharacterized protein LOC121339422 n=1 Tax=Onychostruthus taczanowskii TaxID=356909 RepID=UPI001B80E4FC|nr:uncharacterized protein LOC121339422 [Onychostruthus taczanowskii]
MELEELSPALLQPQVTVVATLGELLATVPRRNEETLLKSLRCLYWDLEDFTTKLWATVKCMDDTWWRRNVTSDNKEPPASLSQALAAYRSTPWTPWFHVTMEAWHWQGTVDKRVDSWAQLARKATKLCNVCREVVTEPPGRAATASARARELQDEAARDGTAQENMVELGQALGREKRAEVVAEHEAWMWIDVMVAASRATRATMVRQRVETALGLLERLVDACDEATTFLQELQRRVGDIKAALEGTNEESPNVPEDLVTKVAVAERLWEANGRLAKDHLLGTLQGIIDFLFNGGRTSPCEVAERCQRAIEDIPRLLRPPDRPQGVPKVSPVSMELQEMSPGLLQPQATMVATLGELVAITARKDGDVLLPMCQPSLREALKKFTNNLSVTVHDTGNIFWHRDVTSGCDSAVPSLSQALAAYASTSWTTWEHVRSVASTWQESAATLDDSWAQLTREVTKLWDACRHVALSSCSVVAMEEVLKKAIKEAMVGAIREALGGVIDYEVGEGVGGTVVAEDPVRQQAKVALGLLRCLVTACREITAFYRELRRRVGEIVGTMKGAEEPSHDFHAALAAKVAVAELLWVASSQVARDYLVGALENICTIFRCGDPSGSIA